MTKKKKQVVESFKIQPTVDSWTRHVLEQLIGIKGTSVSDVANYILKSWISDHINELEKYNIKVNRKNGRLIL